MDEEKCAFCTIRDKLDMFGEWLFDDRIDLMLTDVLLGAVIAPEKKQMYVNLSRDGRGKALYEKRIDIMYCPMCGRKL